MNLSSLPTVVTVVYPPQENNMADVIDSLKRLERSGSEYSKTTEKLLEAAKSLESVIMTAFSWKPEDGPIKAADMGSETDKFGFDTPVGNTYYIEDWHVVTAVPGTRKFAAVSLNRQMALIFSKDIATGLLERISDHIEKLNVEEGEAASILQTARKKISS